MAPRGATGRCEARRGSARWGVLRGALSREIIGTVYVAWLGEAMLGQASPGLARPGEASQGRGVSRDALLACAISSAMTEHTAPECVCDLEVGPVIQEDGSVGWLLVHQPLDGV